MSCHLQLLPNLSLLDTQHFPQQASAVLPRHNVKVRGRAGMCVKTKATFICLFILLCGCWEQRSSRFRKNKISNAALYIITVSFESNFKGCSDYNKVKAKVFPETEVQSF